MWFGSPSFLGSSNMAKKQPQKVATTSDASTKGKLVEFIVASMHNSPGVKVETNVRLTPKNAKTKRKREVDVLLTSHIADYEVRLPIECKNYKKVIGVAMIGEFI